MHNVLYDHPGVDHVEKEPPVSHLLWKVRGWLRMAQARNGALAEPDHRDVAVVAGALVFGPAILLFLLPEIFFGLSLEFARESRSYKLGVVLLAPVVLTGGLFYVVFYVLLGGLLRRMWVRRRILRKADREVKGLMREVGV